MLCVCICACTCAGQMLPLSVSLDHSTLYIVSSGSGLNSKCPPQSWAFEHVIPSQWCCSGTLRWYSLARESTPVGAASRLKHLCSLPLLSLLCVCGSRCELCPPAQATLPASCCHGLPAVMDSFPSDTASLHKRFLLGVALAVGFYQSHRKAAGSLTELRGH